MKTRSRVISKEVQLTNLVIELTRSNRTRRHLSIFIMERLGIMTHNECFYSKANPLGVADTVVKRLQLEEMAMGGTMV